MAHMRQKIREGIAAKLAGLTTTGARVYQARIYPLAEDNLPCILISTLNEQIVSRSDGSLVSSEPRLTERVMEVSIKAVAKAVANIEDLLDTICVEIEKALSADRFLTTGSVKLTDDLKLMTTQINLSGDGEQPTGNADMVWQVTYWCNENSPDEKN